MSQGGTPASVSTAGDRAAGPLLHALIRQGKSFSGRERNCCFLNTGGRFANISAASGLDFSDDGRGVARVDWDHDGDLDLWMANRSGPQVRFLRNEVPTKRNHLTIRLQGRGTATNRDAIGARVEVVVAGVPSAPSSFTKTLRAGDGFLTQSSKWIHFGLGQCQDIERLVIHWPGGKVEEFTGVEPNRRYLVVQGRGRVELWEAGLRSVNLEPSKLIEPTVSDASRVVSSSRLPMPDLDYRTFADKPVQIRHQSRTSESQPLLVNLWASGCVPCLAELNEWQKRGEDLREAGLNVIALCVDDLDTNGSPSSPGTVSIVDRIAPDFTTGKATGATVEKLQMVLDHLFDLHRPLPVPVSFLLDSSGHVAAVYRGRVSTDQLLEDVRSVTDSPDQFALATRFAGRRYMRRNRLSPFDLAWKMVSQAALNDSITLDDAIQYIEENRDLLKDHFHLHKLLVLVGNGRLARGEAKQAAALYREALRINVDYEEAQNNLAWLLATHADENIRNPQEAVHYAELAVAAAGDVAPLLDTLAAAYAADGRFEEAINTAKKAIRLATKQAQWQLAQRIERRLRSYEAGQPYRESP